MIEGKKVLVADSFFAEEEPTTDTLGGQRQNAVVGGVSESEQTTYQEHFPDPKASTAQESVPAAGLPSRQSNFSGRANIQSDASFRGRKS